MAMISIIVPIYNTDKYLNDCLDSIINQSFTDLEIILINDGSTDDSQTIIDDYLNKDSRIIAITQENQGQSVSRNKGIMLAKGKYLSFVDSDDRLDPDMMMKMVEVAEKEDLDLVVCGIEVIMQSSNTSQYINNGGEKLVILDHEEFDAFIKRYYIDSGFGASTCNKLYKREIIIRNKLLFEDYRTLHKEDGLFNLYFLPYSKTLGFINEPLYKYFRRAGSSSTTVKREILNRYIQYFKKLENFITKNGFSFMNNLLYYDYLFIINEIFSVYNFEKRLTLRDVHVVMHRFIEDTNLLDKSKLITIGDLVSVMPINKKSLAFIVYCLLLKMKSVKGLSLLQYLKISLLNKKFD